MADYDLSRPGKNGRGGRGALLIAGAVVLLLLVWAALPGGDGTLTPVAPPVDGAAPDAAPVAVE